MTSSKANNQEPLSSSKLAGMEPSSEHQQEKAETRPEVAEDYKAWLYVLAGFVTYVNIS